LRETWSLYEVLSEASVTRKQYQAHFVEIQRKRRISERADTLGNFALAVAQLEEAVQMCGDCPSKGDLHKNLGLIYCRSGSLDKGERELRVAQGLKPNDPDVKKSLELIAELKDGQAKAGTVH